ncbi:L-rhamnose mutarotase [Kushneria avicenniae]|uniref:L-rhamnose mutarotase n=1 Tax=Kushneria avicenniae TaxID=402385 RepID=A0A1I1JC11_9GAMM|nr:L-rhamnose mutarotase [Kushneria avicenniae]SFC42970.1 L-rhamnose mutarotase [Kushneria avicenniae]
MTLRAFRMTLNPGQEAEYRRRHDEIWPELVGALRAAGVRDYRIFLDPQSCHLFAVMQLDDDHRVDALPELPVMQRWWEHMADLMATHDDASPIAVGLDEVFTLNEEANDARR